MARFAVGCVVVLVSCAWASAVAQTPSTGSLELRPLAQGGRGVSNAALINEPEVRVLRVDVAPGGERDQHTHDNVRFHLFIPITGTMSLQVGDAAPVEVGAWQGRVIGGSTPHSFRNTGNAPVSVVEVFVNK